MPAQLQAGILGIHTANNTQVRRGAQGAPPSGTPLSLVSMSATHHTLVF